MSSAKTTHPAQRRYPPELKERAVRMVQQLRREDGADQGVVGRVARQLGVGTESLRARYSALDTMMNQRLDSKQYETLSVLVVANGTLINEGSSLAVIALDSAETDHSHLDFFDHGIIVCPRHGIPAPAMTVTPDPGRPPGPRPLGDGRYPLPAGERAQFRLQVGMTASEWFSAFERRELDANAGKMTLTITVSGQLAEGPLDQISMEIRAFPILPRQQSDGWFIPGRNPIPGPGGSDAATRQSFLELTKRTYPRLGRRRR